jgi:hypothetical protein
MSQQQPPSHADFGNVIFRYTRQQALEDGVLIDASAMAREAGFTLPVAVTAAAWADAVAWNEADNERQAYQDESGRLWDVLFMAAHAIRSDSKGTQPLLFSLNRIPRDGRSHSSRRLALKLILGPGDDGEPVITILLPGED